MNYFIKKIKWIGVFVPVILFAQNQNHQIVISDIQEHVHKNWLGIPSKVDYSIYWEVYQDNAGEFVKTDFDQFEYFEASCFEKFSIEDYTKSEKLSTNFYTFTSKPTGNKYHFNVKGQLKDASIVISDTAWVVTGKKMHAQMANTGISKWHHWIPVNGRIPLAVIGRQRFFDSSTVAGKIAFHMIWNFLLASGAIWMLYCLRYLRLGSVFPFKKGLSIFYSYDEQYRRRESEEFREILVDWQDIVKQGNDNIKHEINQCDDVCVDDIQGANVKFWRDKGTIGIGKLIERISKPSMHRYPICRIIQTGLETHELGGYHWTEISKEVDRAIENRASSEIENIRRKSLMDWLWNLGTMAPLVGLFGTATGISHAFATLTVLQVDISQTELVKQLASGIYEALWTTIEGLFVGIFCMFLYYFYQNKLNWIYSKWEDIYVHITEKL